MIIRPATWDDMSRVDGPPARTTRAMVAEEDGEVIGIWGIYPFSTRYVLFSSFTPRFRSTKRNFVVAVRSALQLIKSRPRMPVIALADPEIEGSDVLLKHMGFDLHHGRVYEWHG